MLALALVLEGASRTDAARLCGMDRQTLRDWVHRYNAEQGTLTRLWAARGSRPPAPRDQRYAWAYLFGAVCPARDAGAALVLPHANSEAMNLHQAEMGSQVSPGAHAVPILDAPAGASSGAKLRVPRKIASHDEHVYPEPSIQTFAAKVNRERRLSFPTQPLVAQHVA
jgi:hypothetical protein